MTGNHLVDFAPAPGTRWLYAVGSCGYTGGLSAANLRTGKVRVLVNPYHPQSRADMHRRGVWGISGAGVPHPARHRQEPASGARGGVR